MHAHVLTRKSSADPHSNAAVPEHWRFLRSREVKAVSLAESFSPAILDLALNHFVFQAVDERARVGPYSLCATARWVRRSVARGESAAVPASARLKGRNQPAGDQLGAPASEVSDRIPEACSSVNGAR